MVRLHSEAASVPAAPLQTRSSPAAATTPSAAAPATTRSTPTRATTTPTAARATTQWAATPCSGAPTSTRCWATSATTRSPAARARPTPARATRGQTPPIAAAGGSAAFRSQGESATGPGLPPGPVCVRTRRGSQRARRSHPSATARTRLGTASHEAIGRAERHHAQPAQVARSRPRLLPGVIARPPSPSAP